VDPQNKPIEAGPSILSAGFVTESGSLGYNTGPAKISPVQHPVVAGEFHVTIDGVGESGTPIAVVGSSRANCTGGASCAAEYLNGNRYPVGFWYLQISNKGP
jgi:hypothetical protein